MQSKYHVHNSIIMVSLYTCDYYHLYLLITQFYNFWLISTDSANDSANGDGTWSYFKRNLYYIHTSKGLGINMLINVFSPFRYGLFYHCIYSIHLSEHMVLVEVMTWLDFIRKSSMINYNDDTMNWDTFCGLQGHSYDLYIDCFQWKLKHIAFYV